MDRESTFDINAGPIIISGYLAQGLILKKKGEDRFQKEIIVVN